MQRRDKLFFFVFKGGALWYWRRSSHCPRQLCWHMCTWSGFSSGVVWIPWSCHVRKQTEHGVADLVTLKTKQRTAKQARTVPAFGKQECGLRFFQDRENCDGTRVDQGGGGGKKMLKRYGWRRVSPSCSSTITRWVIIRRSFRWKQPHNPSHQNNTSQK